MIIHLFINLCNMFVFYLCRCSYAYAKESIELYIYSLFQILITNTSKAVNSFCLLDMLNHKEEYTEYVSLT